MTIAHGVIAPRALPRLRAAAYVMKSPEDFDLLVKLGHLPQPYDMDGERVWDRIMLATNRKVNAAALFMSFPAPTVERRRRSIESARDKARFDNVSGVYIVAFETFAKIGFSKKMGKRIRTIEEHLPADLRILSLLHQATFEDEKILHRRFEAHRLAREWFKLSDEILQLTARLGPPQPTADDWQIRTALGHVRNG